VSLPARRLTQNSHVIRAVIRSPLPMLVPVGYSFHDKGTFIMNADDGKAGPAPCGPPRAGQLAVTLAGATLLVAGCGGGGRPGGQASTPGVPRNAVAQLDGYAQCMRTHGVPGFYLSSQTSGPNGGTPVLKLAPGVVVPGVNASTPQFASANKACERLMPKIGRMPGAAQLQQLLRQMVKAAACMRTHGYPGWPDPTLRNGQLNPGTPANADTQSPQFQAAQKTCGPA
jgi:hypothetical protein